MPEAPTHSFRPVWLASYPRSGNTFLRIILEKIFRLPTYSLYRIEGQQFLDPSAEPLEQTPVLPREWRAQCSESEDTPLTLIKTHDAPEDDRKAIYLVRDGRAAIESYFHYHKRFAFEQPTLTEIIVGACQFGSWSNHYAAWHPLTRPDTLLLKYEELVQRPEQIIPALGEFLGVTPGDGQLPSFADLNQKFPAFFRRGQNEDFLREWTPGQLSIFNELHGPAMQELGYAVAPASGSSPEMAIELARSAARLHKVYIQELHNQELSLAARDELSTQLKEVSRQVDCLSAEIAGKERLLRPLLRNPWVKIGMALRLVPKNGNVEP